MEVGMDGWMDEWILQRMETDNPFRRLFRFATVSQFSIYSICMGVNTRSTGEIEESNVTTDSRCLGISWGSYSNRAMVRATGTSSCSLFCLVAAVCCWGGVTKVPAGML
jgi:hypothetical protein